MTSLVLLPLSQALGSLEEGIWAASGFSAVGLVVQTVPGDRVQFELRTPAAVSVHLLNPADLPPGLQPATIQGERAWRLSENYNDARAVDRMLRSWGLEATHALEIHTVSETAVLFAALDGDRSFTDGDVHFLRGLAQRLQTLVSDGEPEAASAIRLQRVDALAEVLPILGAALDVREVFARLSGIAARVIPHDSAIVGLLSDDAVRLHLHPLNMPPGVVLPDVIDNPDVHGRNEGWVSVIHRDLAAHPGQPMPGISSSEYRSSVRAAVRLDGEVAGVLDVSSLRARNYNDDDAAVAVRLAEYITLALSHKRLAEAARRAEAQRERTANLEMLDSLLDALSGALDIRAAFQQVSEIARAVLAHDAMAIAITLDNPPRLRVHALSGLGDVPESFETPMPEPFLLNEPWEYRLANFNEDPLYSASPAVKAGMRSVLCIPVRMNGRLHAGVNFYARTSDAFTLDDVMVARRITDHIALALSHEELADQERRSAELRLATEDLEILDELLAAASAEGALEEVIDRVSLVAQKVLPHDALLLASGMAWPAGMDSDLIEDVPHHPARAHLDPSSRGFQSALCVPVRWEGDDDLRVLVLLSKAASAFKQAHVLSARRIADRVALALARDRRAEISERTNEAFSRAVALEARVRELTEELDTQTGARHVLGDSPIWKAVLGQAARVAATSATVLLRGESGTGKEVVARFVHRASRQYRGPFVGLNCAAIPEHLLEAELFGHERGAFTDATQGKPGLLERAAGGTLFLDEVGELSAAAQAKFLRVLQEREFQRLGGTRVLKSDARIIAATNRDLEHMITLGRFREDLYYRLNVFAIRLPLLRERRDDIRPLTDALLAEIVRGIGRPNAGVAADARAKLLDYDWPGNVRELRNVLERAAILCEGGPITSDHLALQMESTASPPPEIEAGNLEISDGGEKAAIERALHDARYNKSSAAKALGLTRAQLYVRMRRHGLD